MRHILLLGAGFSRNWGGFLASEVFDYLFGCPEVLGDAELKQLLWRHQTGGGFENALAELQADCRRGGSSEQRDRLERFQQALARMFNDMKAAFADRRTLEFQQDISRMLGTFLHRFDAIFSLNQDVLMEMFYLNDNLNLSHSRRWSGGELPGMRPMASPSLGWAEIAWSPVARSEFKISAGFQPFFKLHGSSNWVDAEGSGLMVLGGGKTSRIAATEVLDWYREQFAAHLGGERVRLMVIGYGFNDGHVNDAIGQAADGGNLGLFIVDTSGAGVLKKADPRAMIPLPEPLVERFGPHIIGISARPLTGTFGGDEAERAKMMRFFET